MPTYQYVCTVCASPHEEVQAFTDPPLRDCPACGGPLRKVFSSVGVVFKGSGFYRTDSRPPPKSDGEAQPSEKSGSAKPDGGKPEGAKSDGDKGDRGKGDRGKGDRGPARPARSDGKPGPPASSQPAPATGGRATTSGSAA